MPLGDIWGGQCRVPGREPACPDHRTLLECCNLGYARGKCAWFPGEDTPDAVRFAVARDSGAVVTVACIIEKAYLPVSRCMLAYDTGHGCFNVPAAPAGLERQAAAYVASYLLRKRPA